MASSTVKKGVSALSGAGSGAVAGSALGPIGTGVGAVVGGLAGWLSGDGGDNEEEKAKALAAERQKGKDTQYALLNSMQAPVQTASTAARIKALEDQSKSSSLVEDPYFQAQRAGLVQGGQQALSSVNNIDKGQGISGGFSNAGSASDIYDRLSGQLSQLGQNSVNLKDQKATQAAQMQQNFADAQSAFANAQIQAKMAIEAGDSASAMAAIQDAYEAKQKMQDNDSKMLSSGLAGIASLAGGLKGGLDAKNGGLPDLEHGDVSPAEAASLQDSINTLSSVNKAQQASRPWSLMRQ